MLIGRIDIRMCFETGQRLSVPVDFVLRRGRRPLGRRGLGCNVNILSASAIVVEVHMFEVHSASGGSGRCRVDTILLIGGVAGRIYEEISTRFDPTNHLGSRYVIIAAPAL